jgi:hypothetical protein
MGTEELLSQLTSAAIVVYALQWLKSTSLVSFITAETKTLNRWLSALGAFTGAVGIHFAFDVSAGSLVITGLTVTGLLHGGWHWINQFALQQLMYDAAVQKAGVKS